MYKEKKEKKRKEKKKVLSLIFPKVINIISVRGDKDKEMKRKDTKFHH